MSFHSATHQTFGLSSPQKQLLFQFAKFQEDASFCLGIYRYSVLKLASFLCLVHVFQSSFIYFDCLRHFDITHYFSFSILTCFLWIQKMRFYTRNQLSKFSMVCQFQGYLISKQLMNFLCFILFQVTLFYTIRRTSEKLHNDSGQVF